MPTVPSPIPPGEESYDLPDAPLAAVPTAHLQAALTRLRQKGVPECPCCQEHYLAGMRRLVRVLEARGVGVRD